MNSKHQASSRRITRRTALTAAIAMGAGLSGQAFAQATTGTIFGSAPASGTTVQVIGGAGFNRTVPVDSTGHYSVTVPVGDYTVNLIQNGAVVQTHNHVNPSAGGASEADFTQPGGKDTSTLSSVTVTANALPAIDVTSTTQNLTITSQQLTQLPLARNSAAIALLAPGTISGASMLGAGPTGEPLVSFGGSSIVENAYYINGFNTTDPLSNTGGITLPYGSIDQQQTLTSGYGAQYGRSAGGVISQVGKSGTNDWHFGGQVLWQPAFAQSSANNIYWNNPLSTTAGEEYGNLEQYRQANSSWNTVYDAYLGGPLIKDTLFLFLSAEVDKSQGHTVGTVNAGNVGYWKDSDPKFYGKLDWNINSNNILSLTSIYNSAQNAPEQYYNYDNATRTANSFEAEGDRSKTAFKIWIAKYTSYITDNLTLNFLYGKMNGTYYTGYPGYDPSLTYVGSTANENPAYLSCASCYIHNSSLYLNLNDPAHRSEVRNLRLDLDWKLGNHDIQFGIDNDTSLDKDDGVSMSGPGYSWSYGQTGAPGADIIQLAGVGTAGPGTPCVGGTKGCYVEKYVFTSSASVEVMQRAQYIQDNWQITPNFLLNLGLRNDQFTNFNPAGEPYLRLTKPQWAPRIGFSWDVFGDSSMKVFGNAGRYYLAMPTSVALREASDPLYTEQFYTYSGINADGTPVNPVLVPNTFPNNTYYVNSENGTSIPAKETTSANLKAEYQDQFVLGMQQQFKMFGQSWVYGATGTVNKLGRAIDDWYGSEGANAAIIENAAAAQGVTIDPSAILGSLLINPGVANTLRIANGSGGYSEVKLTNADFGFPQLKRNYYSLDLYLEHPFDGKWYGKIDYTFSRSYGDTEGPVESNIGQGGSSQSITEQWDFAQIMSYANGLQANDQKHQLRLYGSYQITPEWSVGGTYRIASGTPVSCLGFYGPNQSDPGGYSSSYHWCNGVPTPGGTTGFTPWTHQLNLQVDYRPAFANHKLDFQLQVHNVFNEQNVTQYYGQYNQGFPTVENGTVVTSINPQHLLPYSLESPRYVQFGITYDY
ncbi:TonB-dependent receptor [Rhodanobacter sp. DHG33]|uniref:TonB-dependent receptor plug domain-containing protein n=1 Tax=Rhodanobacter sp. DHG33 TaxID=2775921 RepID=UPI001785D5BE|nr:TonB-dependent receptor [Rhodanobacter sp. DHG33]MBD8899922.1 TonB-dependent receptor [Rhodanobacter sp. DHG33]